MQEHILQETDTLELLSARYSVPVCMIMRANAMQSSPGRRAADTGQGFLHAHP